MRRSILFLLNIVAGTALFAQQKQLTMREAVLGLSTNLARKDLNQLQWIPKQSAYSELVKTTYGNALIRTRVPSLSVDTIISSALLKQQLPATGMNMLPRMEWLDSETMYFQQGREIYLLNLSNENTKVRKWASLPTSAENIEIDKAARQIAYTAANNLYLVDRNGTTTNISAEPNMGIVSGQAVHRREFGIEKGTFFSPRGTFLAYYRMDESMVEQYPLINWNTVPASVHYTRYPFAGRSSHQVSLGIYNPKTQKTIFLDTGTPKDQYLTCVTWSPDEKHIYVGILNRDQNHLKLNKYDVTSGRFLKTLFEEKDSKYVQPQHPLFFVPGRPHEFIWFSQRDGFMHLYRYNTEGKLLARLTRGNWLVNDVIGANQNKKQLYILTSKDSPMEKHLYAVNWNDGRMNRLDREEGTHNPLVNTEGTFFIDKWSSAATPRKIELASTDTKFRKVLLSANDPMADYQRPKVENITLKADDGTPLYGKLIYPANFDATKKYPVIVYLYNGPNVQIITNNYPASGNLWYEYMAQHGFFIFTMDGRGSSNRGLKFEQATFRQLGTIEMKDQMEGVKYLKSLPFIDNARMGIHGWSFGGFMTTSFMLRNPDVFKCAVAGGPVMDWKMYEVMYTERYMDTPQDNPEGYENANLLSKVKNLKGKLLLIHGSIDSTVVWQNSVDFIKKAVDENVQVDYFVYPGHEHNVRGTDRVHLMQKISDYFEKNL